MKYTLDQIELILTLFQLQNRNRKLSEFGVRYLNFGDITIGDLQFTDKKTFSYLLRSDFARVLSSVVQMAYADSI